MRLNLKSYFECPLESYEKLELISEYIVGRLAFLASYCAIVISSVTQIRVAGPLGTFVKVTVAVV